MEQDLFKNHLKAAVYCNSDYYGCSDVKTPGWVRLLGWGNYNAKVCFVGINPLLSEKAIVWHRCPVGLAPEEHASDLASKGFENVEHFAYHKRILEASRLPNNKAHLKEIAFFTEVVVCPSKDASSTGSINDYCFKKRIMPFLRDANFKVIISLGRKPTEICLKHLGLAEDGLGDYHGKVYPLKTGGFLIGSFHPSYRYKAWDRSLVAKRINELIEKQFI